MALSMDNLKLDTIFYKQHEDTPKNKAGATISVMPPETPLSMPVQSLSQWQSSDERLSVSTRPNYLVYLERIFVFLGAFFLTAYGTNEMYQVVSVSRTTFLQWLLVALFVINFSWIALSFTSAVLGFLILLFRANFSFPVPEKLAFKTAVIMPVYNEGTERVFAAIQAMRESIEQTGLGNHFDYFLLSDSTNPDAWIAEQQAFLDLVNTLGIDARIYYRHRSKNTHRKSGNIADFVTRWGASYEHMLVLDADSIMTGECIVRLAGAMEADPDSGIIQSLPLIINRNTFFARLQQFAARVYGPVIATGVAAWSERDGNYWGHNAIIRTKAFAAHCGLPVLRGKPPLGGHILSHDFIEAALIRRAGWSVYSLTGLEGSYEESPPSLIDLSIRDRRWCQGNLQHTRIVLAKGLKLPTRQHLFTGIFSYLAAPFWLSQLLIGILLVWQSTYIRPEYFTDFGLLPIWPRFDAERALALFILTMGILLAPKFFGITLTLLNSKERKACGGFLRLFISSFIEIIMSALIAPVLTVIQSNSVIQILAGRDAGWNPQRRDDGSIPWKDVYLLHRWHTLLGLISGLSAFMISTSLFLWMSPTITGLILAIPLSWCSGQLALGLALKKVRLLMTPEEGTPPTIVHRIKVFQNYNTAQGYNELDGLVALKKSKELTNLHLALLPKEEERTRGQVDTDLAVAELKIRDANSVYEASLWLSPRERTALLKNRNLLDKLLKLPLVFKIDDPSQESH